MLQIALTSHAGAMTWRTIRKHPASRKLPIRKVLLETFWRQLVRGVTYSAGSALASLLRGARPSTESQ
jgi:hypothetical protein